MGNMAEASHFDRSDDHLSGSRLQRALSEQPTERSQADLHRQRVRRQRSRRRLQREHPMKWRQKILPWYIAAAVTINIVMQVGRIKGWWN